jgi:hypothetical protein
LGRKDETHNIDITTREVVIALLAMGRGASRVTLAKQGLARQFTGNPLGFQAGFSFLGFSLFVPNLMGSTVGSKPMRE